MRELDRGHSFVVTRNGTAVGKLIPIRRSQFVSTESAVAAFAGISRVDTQRFREDVDAIVSQDAEPHA